MSAKVMDADQLRATYNKYFSGSENKWSSTNLNETLRLANWCKQWLTKQGLSPTPNFLDVGCATGYFTEAFRRIGFQVTGIDYSEVALEKARENFPMCTFVQMNGFEPVLTVAYDVIFCRGFSGMNTHSLEFISEWSNKYIDALAKGGYFILAYGSDFSGTEKPGETVNLSRAELDQLCNQINAECVGTRIYYYLGVLSKWKRVVMKNVFRKKGRDYFYILFRKK